MHGVLTDGLEAPLPRVLAFTTAWWDDNHPPGWHEAGLHSMARWYDRVKTLLSPVEVFLACGTWSEPRESPIQVPIINSGVTYQGGYYGQRRHYGKCALSAACAYALNRRDWDLLCIWDNDALVGNVDFNKLLLEFMGRPEIVLAPSWCGMMGGPVLFWKRDAVSRLLHNRQSPNMRDDDEEEFPGVFEQEWLYIFRGGRWWNPWPKYETMSANGEEHFKVLEEDWPMVRLPGNSCWPEYVARKCPLAKPLTPELDWPPIGQVLPDSLFGKELTRMAEMSDKIVEIGTWKGEGSTRCLNMGMIFPQQRMWTVEADLHMSRSARMRHFDYRINFLHGSVVVDPTQLDIPIVLDRLPDQIDLLLIDGNDYLAKDELATLKDRSKIIALDDTREVKNKENLSKLLADGWQTISENQEDRYGWAVLSRP